MSVIWCDQLTNLKGQNQLDRFGLVICIKMSYSETGDQASDQEECKGKIQGRSSVKFRCLWSYRGDVTNKELCSSKSVCKSGEWISCIALKVQDEKNHHSYNLALLQHLGQGKELGIYGMYSST
jgi:hypothetical protein